MIEFLGVHAQEETIPMFLKHTNVFQVMLHSPLKFELNPNVFNLACNNFRTLYPDCLFVVHGPYFTNIQSENKLAKQSALSIKYHMEAMDRYKMPLLVIHPGTRNVKNPLDVKDVTMWEVDRSAEYLVGMLKRYIPKSFKNGTRVCIENMSSTTSKGLPPEVIVAVVKHMRSEGWESIGFCFDLAHAYGRGDALEKWEGFIEAADVVHFNATPEKVKFGDGKDLHSETALQESKGIPPEQLVSWLKKYPNKVKILEQDFEPALRTFEYVSSL